MTRPSSSGVAVVTGAARGIGLACARLLAERGATVVAADLDGAAAEAAAASFGGHGRAVDVGDPGAVAALAEAVERDIGPVVRLVTSAGVIPGAATPPDDTDWGLWDRMFQVNVRGSFACAAAFGRRMAGRGGGSIVMVGSLAGLRSTSLHAYGPSKAAVHQIVQNLAVQWGRAGVRVNAVAPGYVRTDTFAAAVAAGHREAAALEAQAALGRMVEADEIARVVAFLLSDEAAAVTGVTLPVDAGAAVAASWTVYGGVPDAPGARQED